ncbi:hypothetical protein [Sandaracinus amylolyticus]|uniref:hypothetical protein n=1 Tax=Sandaracinus amylolyticus TaxID=927083 RepID=UPI001F434BDC|nr:hypothetical protein [Sandaracinus amylolyticus]
MRARTTKRAWIGIGIVVIAASASAQDTDPLLAARSSDPLELGRVVDRVGDDAVVARIASEELGADVRLAAVRAAPAMHAPERALEALAAVAAGRDPDLAPAAAHAMLDIARALDPQALDAREVMREELAPARAAIAAILDDESARGDIRRAAGISVEILTSLGVP